MLESFREGGAPMIPTAAFGLMLLVATIRYAMRPERRLVPLQLALAILTLSTGALGFVAGVIKSLTHLDGVEPSRVVQIGAIGVGESLHNLALALMFIAFGALALTIGALRLPRPSST